MIAYICMHCLGSLKATLRGIIQAIQELKHYVCTAFGDLEQHYRGDKSKPPLQGLLQGNAMAPPGWSAMATAIMDAMKNKGFGYETWSLISTRVVTIVAFQFIDDTDIILSDNSLEPKELILKAQ
jgi:hypothetical protein